MAAKKDDVWTTEGRWYEQSKEDVGGIVFALGTSLKTEHQPRRMTYERMVHLYEGDDNSFAIGSTHYHDQDLNYNVSRAACDTVHAEIAGRQKPTAKFQTAGADWKTKRKAKKMEKFVTGIIQQRQGHFLNGWELFESNFLDASIAGMGVAKVFVRGDKINIERHLAFELFVDPNESRYGDPQNLFHVYSMERDKAIWAFAMDPDLDLSDKQRTKIARAINAAEETDDMEPGTTPRVAKSIEIVEAWRLPLGKDRPGRHVFCINELTLHDEEWTRPVFPFVFQRWEVERTGWHAKGLIQQCETIALEINYNASKLQERFRLCGSKRTYYEEGSISPTHLQSNEAEVMIPIKHGAMIPKDAPPKPIAESEFAWSESVFQKYFELSGVSQMQASARKEAGVTAAVAIRTLNDMQSQRFALKAKMYENSYVALAHQILYCAREAAEAGNKVVAKYDEEINWVDVDIPEDVFEITIAPTSALPNDPAGRMQMTQELFAQGIIGMETYKQLLGWPDLEKEMNLQNAQGKWLEKRIDIMLDSTDDYEMPDGNLMDKPRALIQTAQAYFDALYEDAPEENLVQLRDYMQDLDRLIKEAEEGAAIASAELQMKVRAAMMPPGGAGEEGPTPGPEAMPPAGGMQDVAAE